MLPRATREEPKTPRLTTHRVPIHFTIILKVPPREPNANQPRRDGDTEARPETPPTTTNRHRRGCRQDPAEPQTTTRPATTKDPSMTPPYTATMGRTRCGERDACRLGGAHVCAADKTTEPAGDVHHRSETCPCERCECCVCVCGADRRLQHDEHHIDDASRTGR